MCTHQACSGSTCGVLPGCWTTAARGPYAWAPLAFVAAAADHSAAAQAGAAGLSAHPAACVPAGRVACPGAEEGVEASVLCLCRLRGGVALRARPDQNWASGLTAPAAVCWAAGRVQQAWQCQLLAPAHGQAVLRLLQRAHPPSGACGWQQEELRAHDLQEAPSRQEEHRLVCLR